MFKIITKADILLFFVLLAVGAGSLISLTAKSADGSRAVISRGSEVIASCPLDENCVIYLYPDRDPVIVPDSAVWRETAPGSSEKPENILVIRDGSLEMVWSTCENQICVNTGSIHETHQSIVCLPHRLSAEISDGSGTGAVDALSY